ncbi:MAG: hypothetical protein ACKOZN_12275 [Cyanobium sp.]
MTASRQQRSHGKEHGDRLQATLVQQWADLLELLLQGVEAVATSAEDMARELPRELVSPVNWELEQRGSSFRVPGRRLRTAAGPRPGGPHAPAARAAALHRCG